MKYIIGAKLIYLSKDIEDRFKCESREVIITAVRSTGYCFKPLSPTDKYLKYDHFGNEDEFSEIPEDKVARVDASDITPSTLKFKLTIHDKEFLLTHKEIAAVKILLNGVA